MMDRELREIREIRLENLVSFRLQTAQEYQGERLDQLMSSIDRVGLMNPIIVRPIDEGKYEIICGHNRTNAMKKLGREVICAEIKDGLSDDEALELFYDSNLNQQSFYDWNYSQKIKAIQYTERLIKENSQQGKRSDLAEEITDEGTSVQSRHKSDEKPRRSTTRDRMARRLGIATATLSKYRSIIKLPDDLIEILAQMLDEKKITFETAYRMSMLREVEVRCLVECLEKSPDKKVDLVKLKSFCNRGRQKETICPISPELIRSLLISKKPK